MGQHYTGNVGQEAPGNIEQKKFLCSVVLILLRQYYTGKTLCNEATLHIKKFCSTLHR